MSTGTHLLKCSALGYATEFRYIEVRGEEVTTDFALVPAAGLEVHVTAPQIAAGGQGNYAQQALVLARLTDRRGRPVPGASVRFAVTAPSVRRRARFSPALATTDADGYARALLDSSDQEGLASVTVTAGTRTRRAAVRQVVPDYSIYSDFHRMFPGDYETTPIMLSVGRSTPLRSHDIAWRMTRVWDDALTLRFNADESTPPAGDFGFLSNRRSATAQSGTARVEYHIGRDTGWIEIEATDLTVFDADGRHPALKIIVQVIQ